MPHRWTMGAWGALPRHVAALVALILCVACSKKQATPPPVVGEPMVPPTEEQAAPPVAPPAAPPPAPATATAEVAPADATDPRANAWGIVHPPATVQPGDRVYVVTKGRDRKMDDARAVYQLFAHDVAAVDGDVVAISEVGGGTFRVGASFVIPAGVRDAKSLSVGDAVLAEWASSLKHAIVEGFDGPADQPDRVRIRYTDLPETWPDDKVTASRTPRELTRIMDGLHPGVFAMVHDDGRDILVMLLSNTPSGWLVQRFGGRLALFAADKLVPVPVRAKVQKGQKVRVPWVGMMVPGKVVKIKGIWAWASVSGIGQKEPISAAIGQILPEPGPSLGEPAGADPALGKGKAAGGKP